MIRSAWSLWGVTPLFWPWLAGKLHPELAPPRVTLGKTIGRPILLALRGVRPYANETHAIEHRPEYDDTGILLEPGQLEPLLFSLCTHAYQQRSRQSPDVNADGAGDVASIRPGRYVLEPLDGLTFHVRMPDGSDRIPCWRDVDGDRKLDQAERSSSERATSGPQTDERGHWANAVLMHVGFTSGRSSIACLTASEGTMRMLRSLRTAIDLVLVDAADVVPLALEHARELGGHVG